MEIKEKIFQELRELEAAADKLRIAAHGAKNQTDLEVAILERQLADQRKKNRHAGELIDESIKVLKGIE
ncbi:MAG: hypothetical protein FWE50_00670 [Alphaproteobacteria bacterium]|nr:hypothetical protein [Alphaproteobacteria bacterium]